MPVPTLWYCGYCSYGPMTIANNGHCCMCQRQRDVYATYEVQEIDALNSRYGMPPPAPSTCWIGSKLDHPSTRIEEPQRSLSIGLDPEWGAPLPNCARTYAVRSSMSTCGTICNPPPHPPPPTTWYCCQCKDGPKSIRLELKCVECCHKRCKDCRSERPESLEWRTPRHSNA